MSIPNIISNPLATKAFDNLVGAWKEYAITAEIEQTKRENIKTFRDTSIKAIEESSAILKAYLERVFKERASVIQGMFEHLDKSLASGNTQSASEAIAAIVSVTKESPLAGAVELIASINDPNVKSIEI